ERETSAAAHRRGFRVCIPVLYGKFGPDAIFKWSGGDARGACLGGVRNIAKGLLSPALSSKGGEGEALATGISKRLFRGMVWGVRCLIVFAARQSKSASKIENKIQTSFSSRCVFKMERWLTDWTLSGCTMSTPGRCLP